MNQIVLYFDLDCFSYISMTDANVTSVMFAVDTSLSTEGANTNDVTSVLNHE